MLYFLLWIELYLPSLANAKQRILRNDAGYRNVRPFRLLVGARDSRLRRAVARGRREARHAAAGTGSRNPEQESDDTCGHNRAERFAGKQSGADQARDLGDTETSRARRFLILHFDKDVFDLDQNAAYSSMLAKLIESPSTSDST